MTIGVPGTDYKSCIMKNAGEDRLKEVIAQNLSVLENQVEYNSRNGIMLFRISSDIIPFGSSPVNALSWKDLFEPQLTRIGDKIRAGKMRVSMHPGQYTVLNSPNEEVYARAVEDLVYHTQLLNSLHTGPENKIILHIGGIYGEKKEAARRFAARNEGLDQSVKQRLVIENDEKSFDICDVLEISGKTGAPAVFDNLHHAIHLCPATESEISWIRACRQTWRPQDGRQKIHYSQQAPGKKPGAHSDSIRIEEFLSFYDRIEGENLDIMLEVKDKNLSAVKCINCTDTVSRQFRLELDWSRYKYLILEKAPAIYLQIRELLKDRSENQALAFYRLIELAMQQEASTGNVENAALHVWGYFKNIASESQKNQFFRILKQIRGTNTGAARCKNYLLKLAQLYDQKYLLDSLYLYL